MVSDTSEQGPEGRLEGATVTGRGTVEWVAEQWQFFAFVFAALVTLVFTLLSEISDRPWRIVTKVVAFLLLGYLLLFKKRVKSWLVRLLRIVKK